MSLIKKKKPSYFGQRNIPVSLTFWKLERYQFDLELITHKSNDENPEGMPFPNCNKLDNQLMTELSEAHTALLCLHWTLKKWDHTKILNIVWPK